MHNPSWWGLNRQKSLVDSKKEREKEMKIVKASTVRKSVSVYASRVGFRVECDPFSTNADRYSIFDIRADYYIRRNVNMDTVVRLIIDELYAKMYRLAACGKEVSPFVLEG